VIAALFIVLIVLFVVLPLLGWALWTLVSMAIVGLILGGLGRIVLPGRHPIGAVPTILSGLIGSILGGFIGREVGVGHLATVLLEIGVAAVAVGSFSAAGSRRQLPGPGRYEIH